VKRSEALAAAQVLAQADLDSARANYEGLLHLTKADEGAVGQAEEQIHRASLRSPINGIAIALYVHTGEMLGSATAVAGLGPNAAVSKPTNTLMTIAEQGDLEVDADVNAVDMGGVLTGQKANFTIDAFQPEVFSGTVRSIALQPTITNGVTTYRVVVSIPRPDQPIPHRYADKCHAVSDSRQGCHLGPANGSPPGQRRGIRLRVQSRESAGEPFRSQYQGR